MHLPRRKSIPVTGDRFPRSPCQRLQRTLPYSHIPVYASTCSHSHRYIVISQKYLYESRHRHAVSRTRGHRGRFEQPEESSKNSLDSEVISLRYPVIAMKTKEEQKEEAFTSQSSPFDGDFLLMLLVSFNLIWGTFYVTPSLPRVINFKFPLQPH